MMPFGQKILVVDDAPMNILILKNILKGNYTLASAESGTEALEIIPEFRPDLILLDIMMPGMDGYEVCRKIREQEQYRFIKIIMVSAKTMIDDRLKGYQVGADDYITKPFDKKELEAKIRVFSQLKHEEELNQLKGNLLMLFSHETKTPLSIIIGLAAILHKKSELEDDSKRHVGTISEEAYDMLEFIVPYVVTDNNYNITEVNDKFFEQFGYTREEILGKSIKFLTSDLPKEEILQPKNNA